MKTLPALPEAVHSALGPVPVELVADLKAKDGDDCLGLWLPVPRVIKICDGMAPVTAWVTLVHERIHQILWDAGVPIDGKQEESVCDAIGTALVAEMLAALEAE